MYFDLPFLNIVNLPNWQSLAVFLKSYVCKDESKPQYIALPGKGASSVSFSVFKTFK